MKGFKALSIALYITYNSMSNYTKNELALLDFISNVNKQFSYIGEENDQVSVIDVKRFTDYCIKFIDALEKETK